MVFEADGELPKQVGIELLEEIRDLGERIELMKRFEQGYVDEIQRLNSLLGDLVAFVETISDTVSDVLGKSEVSDDLRKQVVDMILISARHMRKE